MNENEILYKNYYKIVIEVQFLEIVGQEKQWG